MHKLWVLCLLAVICNKSTFSQNRFWKSKQAYLAQPLPNDTPQAFAAKLLVPDSGIALDRSAFSSDGKEFYYCTANHWVDASGAKIKYFKYEGKKWTGPFVMNEGYYAPTFSINNKTMYLLGGKGDNKHAFVWSSHRAKDRWQNPKVYLSKEYGLYDFMPTISGAYYVGSNAHSGSRKDFSTYDICTLHFNKSDTLIERLNSPVNTSGFEGDFFIAPDESYLIISNKETPDFESELAISFCKPDHTWTSPLSLGSLINDGKAHRWGEYVTPDGKYLFYSKGTSEKDCHLYWVRFDLFKQKLHDEAFANNK